MSNISAKPNPRYRFLFFRKKKEKNFHQKFVFFETGRDAMLFGLENLNFDKKKTILIPGYICYSFVEPIIKKGFKVEYYDVNKNLSLDLQNLKDILKNKNVSALVIVHYFGFLIDIKEIYDFCKSKNIELIEDYCHSFLSRIFYKNNNTFNTTKIYSMRKTIPITDGGAIENSKFNQLYFSHKSFFSPIDLSFLILRFLESLINQIGMINLYCNFYQNFKRKIKKIKSIFKKELVYEFKISFRKPSYMLGRYINSEEYLNHSFAKRRSNYNFLLKEIKKLGFKILYKKLSDYSVPQFFPILLDKKNKLLFEHLNEKGIETIKWPSHEMPKLVLNNKNKFQNSIFFNENIILIPVHQSLSENNCHKIIEILKSFSNKNELLK